MLEAESEALRFIIHYLSALWHLKSRLTILLLWLDIFFFNRKLKAGNKKGHSMVIVTAILPVYLETKFDPFQDMSKSFRSPSVVQNNTCYCNYKNNLNMMSFLWYKTNALSTFIFHFYLLLLVSQIKSVVIPTISFLLSIPHILYNNPSFRE